MHRKKATLYLKTYVCVCTENSVVYSMFYQSCDIWVLYFHFVISKYLCSLTYRYRVYLQIQTCMIK